LGQKTAAVFLAGGGLLGLANVIRIGLYVAQRHMNFDVLPAFMSVAIFVCCISTGIGLWRAVPWGLRLATILLALQIPLFNIGRFVYEFSALLSVRLLIGDTSSHFLPDIGSSFNVALLLEPVGLRFGINIVAAAMLAFLIWVSRSDLKQKRGRNGPVKD